MIKLRKWVFLLAVLLAPSLTPGQTYQTVRGWCEAGAQPVLTSGLTSTTQVQASYPQCTVTVFIHGGGLATIYSTDSGGPQTNPFTAQTNGQWSFYVLVPARVDVQLSGAGMLSPVTYSDIFVGASGGGGGGSPPVGPVNSLQKNNLGAFGPSSVIDDGSTVTVGEDTKFCGPNPYIDVRCYNARAVSTVPTTTASISSGTALATLGSASTFQNNDGVIIYGAGPAITMATPGAPTVTPSLAAGALRTLEVVSPAAGATTYNYQIVARDFAGGLTLAGAVGSTATGLTTLGRIAVNVTSMSRTNNTVSVVMSAPTSLVVGAAFWLESASDVTFNGAYIVATAADSTHFTFLQTYDTRVGATTSATGGTVSYYVGNRLSWTAVAGAWQYYIYGRTGGTLTYIGASTPLETTFDDYGATIMGAPFVPSYITTNPPVAAVNDPLVTTIVSGAGTTVLVLANNASNTVAGATIKFDDGINILAARTAAGTTPLYFPSTPTGSFVINSATDLTSSNITNIWQAGAITINETVKLKGAFWQGIFGGEQMISNASRLSAVPVRITSTPGIYVGLNGPVQVKNIEFDALNDQALIWLEDNTFPASKFDDVTFVTGNSGINEDYMGIAFEGRATILPQFNNPTVRSNINNFATPIGLYAPSLYFRSDLASNTNSSTQISVTHAMFNAKGMVLDTSFLNGTVNVNLFDIYTEGSRTPMFIEQASGCCLGGVVNITDMSMDTTNAPMFTNFTNFALGVTFSGGVPSSSGYPPSTGNPSAVQVGGFSSSNTTTTGPLALTSSSYTPPNYFGTNTPSVYGSGAWQYATSVSIAAPGVSLSAGGFVPVGAHTYTVQFLDINNHGGPLSAVAAITTTIGNQIVSVTRPVPPAGMINWTLYRDALPVHDDTTGCNFGSHSLLPMSQTVGTDSGTFGVCGNDTLPNLAGVTMISQSGLSGPRLILMNSGFTTTTDYTSPLTANRFVHLPDATGTLAFTDLAQTFTATQTLNNASQLRFLSSNGVNYAGFQGGASVANLVWLLPTTDSTGTQCLSSNGSLQFAWSACSGGTGTPGGSNTHVQFNNSGSFGGSANLTWVSPALSIGATGSATGQLKLVGTTSGTVTVQSQDAAGTWTFKLPTSAGSNGQPLLTDGTGIASWSTLGAFGGGTGLSSPTAHSLIVTEGASNYNLVTSPAVNGFYPCGFNVSASAAVDPTCALSGIPVDASNPPTLLYSHRANEILFSGTTNTFTLPFATGNLASNFPFVSPNFGSGNLTTTATSPNTIDGGSAGGSVITLPGWNRFWYQDNSQNWHTINMPMLSAFGATCTDPIAWSTTTGFSCLPGTSGGIPYFSALNTWASSGLLGLNLPVIGGGAGGAPTTGTVTGNTTQFATWSGPATANRCVDTDASGNLHVFAVDCGASGGGQVDYPVSYQTRNEPVGLSLTAPSTVANTITATSLITAGGATFSGRQAILAGTMLPSTNGLKTIKVYATGTLGTAVTNFGLTVTVKLGGTTLSSITAPTITALTADGWQLEYYITVNGITTANVGGCMTLIGTSASALMGCSSGASVSGLNFATDQNIDVIVTWANANASNTITANALSVFSVQGI